MTIEAERFEQPPEDSVSNVLKWILLVIAVASFAILGWTTKVTYEAAPPVPDRFVSSNGAVLMTGPDIQAGKAGFQKADLMDYGSLYGMGRISVRITRHQTSSVSPRSPKQTSPRPGPAKRCRI
jgi:nitric oxide reductase subunit B